MIKLKNWGFERVQLHELNGMSFSDMKFFEQWIPKNAEVVDVKFYHEFGYYDEVDQAYISIEWKLKE